jgi:hypothetical protein
MLHSDSTGNTIEGLAQFDLTKDTNSRTSGPS